MPIVRSEARGMVVLDAEATPLGILAYPGAVGANVIGGVGILWGVAAPALSVFVYGERRNGLGWALASQPIHAHPAAFRADVIAVVRQRRIGRIVAKDLLISAFGAIGNGSRAARTRRRDANHFLMMANISRVVRHRFGMRAAKNRLISACLSLHHGQIGAVFVSRHGAVAGGSVSIGVVALKILVT